MKFQTIAMYHFSPLENLPELRKELKQKCAEWGFTGTILIAPEGINCFLYGAIDQLNEFKHYITHNLKMGNPPYKENPCDFSPFRRMLVKIKKEIIAFGIPGVEPAKFTAPYLPAKQLKAWLDEKKEIVLLDTRNTYEIVAGTFNNVTHLNIDHFRKFPEAVKSLLEEHKDKTIVTFCTGGIRCEKAAAYMIQEGFKDVYQLQGGILQYFVDCQGAHYEGNCFVFDWRLSVDPQLNPQEKEMRAPGEQGRHVRLDPSEAR